MDKVEALKEVARDANNMKPSKTSLARLKRALRVLGLTEAEISRYLSFCDFGSFDDCNVFHLYPKFL